MSALISVFGTGFLCCSLLDKPVCLAHELLASLFPPSVSLWSHGDCRVQLCVRSGHSNTGPHTCMQALYLLSPLHRSCLRFLRLQFGHLTDSEVLTEPARSRSSQSGYKINRGDPRAARGNQWEAGWPLTSKSLWPCRRAAGVEQWWVSIWYLTGERY